MRWLGIVLLWGPLVSMLVLATVMVLRRKRKPKRWDGTVDPGGNVTLITRRR